MSNRETITIESAGPADTAIIGQAVGTALPPGTLLTLQGTLGAGKTNLVQAIADALGIDRKNVVSPTFTMIQIHHGQLKNCLLYTSPSPRDQRGSRMPSSA